MGIRIGVYFIGLAITAFGISCVILSKLGAGPWDIVAVGLNKHLGFTVGTWSIIAQALLVIFTSFIEKTRPRWESVVPIVIRSCILDFWLYLVFKEYDLSGSLLLQGVSFVTGVITIGAGIGIYVVAGFPKTPVDALMMALQDRFGWSFSAARTLIEASALFLGYLLGGPVGLGTFFITVSLGRIVQISNLQMRRLYQYPPIVNLENKERKVNIS